MRTPPIAFKANTPGLHSHSNLLEAKLRSTSPKPQKIDSAPLTNRAPPPERKMSASTNNIYTLKKDATFAIPKLMPLSQPTARDSGNGLNNSLGESSKIKVPSNRDFGAQDSSAITLEVEMGPIPQVRDMKSTGQAEESKDGDTLTKTAEGEEKAICHAENVNDTNGDDESEIFFDASMNGGNSEISHDGTASQTVPHLSTTNTDGTFATFNSKELFYASQPPANPQETITSENNDSTIIENDAQPVNATDILDNSDENKVPIAVHAVLVEETTKEIAYEILSGSTSLSKLSKDVGLPSAEKVSIADSTSPAEPATMTGTSVMVSSSEQLVQEKTETGRQVHPQNPLLGSRNALGTSLVPKNESTTSDNSLREGVVNDRSSSSLIGSTKPAVPATRPQQRVTPEKGRVVATTAPAISAAPPQTVEAAAPVKEIPPYMLPRALPESTAPMFMWKPNATLSEPRRKKKIVVKEVEQKQTFWTRLTGRGKKETEVEGAKKKSGQKSKGRNDDSDSYSDSSSDSESDESTSSYEDSNSSDSSAASGRNNRSRRKHSRRRSEKVQNVKKKEGADVERSKSDRGDRRSKKEEKGDKIVRKSRSAGHRNDDRDGRRPRSRQSSTEREGGDGKNRSSKEKVGRSKSDRGERKPKQEGTERRSRSARSRGDGKSSRSHRSSDERESGEDTARTETPKREPDGYQPLPKSETMLKGDGGVSNSRGALETSSSANPHQNNNMPEKKPPAPPMLFVERPMLETLIPVDLILEDQQIEVPVQDLDDPVLLIMTSCFPEEDASLLHSILEGHEFDLEKSIAACRSYGFTEKTSAIQNALAPREPANIGIDTSVKLMRLHGNFPELTKDVLSSVLLAHKGDVNSAEAYLLANGENMNFHRVASPAMPLSTETRKDPINGEGAPHTSNRIIPLGEIRDEDVEEDLT